MKVNHHQIYKAVITGQLANEHQQKELRQRERKLLLLCSKSILENGDIAPIKQLEGKGKEINKLIKKLEQTPNPKVLKCSNFICRFIRSFFKGIGNLLSLRVGSRSLTRQLAHTYYKKFPNHEVNFRHYKDIISTLMGMHGLDSTDKHSALKTIESFFLLSMHMQNDSLRFLNGKLSGDLIKEKTDLSIDLVNVDEDQIEKAHEDLWNKYQEAKGAGVLHDFFTQAFKVNDKKNNKNFGHLCESIRNFNVPAPDPFRIHDPFIRKQNPDNRLNPDIRLNRDHNKPPFVPPLQEPNFFHPLCDKDETMYNMLKFFEDLQLYQYASELHIENLPLDQIRERIIGDNNLKTNFYANFANADNFEDYLKDKNFIGRNCKDGPLTSQEVANRINNFVEELGQLGRGLLLNKEADKQETIYNYCLKFQKKQMKKYQQANAERYRNHSKNVIENDILQRDDFYNNYASKKKFEKYLNKENVIGKNCTDGELKREDLPDLMKNLIGLLIGEEVVVQPRIIPQNPIGYNRQPDNPPPVNNGAPIEPIKDIAEYTQLYQEMIQEVMKQYQYQGRAYQTITGIYKLVMNRKEVINFIGRTRHCEFCPSIGLLMHCENPPKDTLDIANHAPKILFEQYKKHKKDGKLHDLFAALQDGGGPCLEGRLYQLDDYLIRSGMLENVNTKLLLKPPLIPLVNDKEKKQKNILYMVEIFRELQARKFYKDKNDVEVHDNDKPCEGWIATEIPNKPHAKLDIINNEEFQKAYNTRANFIKFLTDEVKILEGDKKTSEGPFTMEELNEQAQFCVDALLLEVI